MTITPSSLIHSKSAEDFIKPFIHTNTNTQTHRYSGIATFPLFPLDNCVTYIKL